MTHLLMFIAGLIAYPIGGYAWRRLAFHIYANWIASYGHRR